MAQIKVLTLRQRAQVLGEECGGYSADRYRSWASVAYALLNLGLNEREAEAVMRSKHTRWAADQDDTHRYGYHPGHIIADYLTAIYSTPEDLATEVVALIEGTFHVSVTDEEVEDLITRLTQAWPKRRKEGK